MKNIFIFLLTLLSILKISAQDFQKVFESMSFKDKVWVIKNYDCVLQVMDISMEVMQVMDSLDKEKYLGGNSEGGKFDAMRHIFWMWSLTNEVGEECSRKLGQIYENYGEYVFYTKELSGYDSVGKQMDLFNNELGISLSQRQISKELIFREIEEILNRGEAKVIKKNQNGESLDVKDEIILENEWKSNWNNRRVLVNSNYDFSK